MATLAQTSVLTPQEYLTTSDFEPDAEYVDGRIEERPMGELDHTTWQQALELWFLAHGREWGLHVRSELRVQVSSTRYRVPDVVVWDRNAPTEQILRSVPVAVFEVLSPEDRMQRMLEKLHDYDRMGVRNIFVIDQASRFFRFSGGALQPTQRAELEGHSGYIDFQEALTKRDEYF